LQRENNKTAKIWHINIVIVALSSTNIITNIIMSIIMNIIMSITTMRRKAASVVS